jgi:hypothetical protein
VALETDTVCVGCHQPLPVEGEGKPKRTKMPLHAKLALMLTALGGGLGLVLGYAFFPVPPGKSWTAVAGNWALFAGAGGGIGAIVGYALGVLVFEKEEAKVRPRPEPQAQEAPSGEPTAQTG